MTEPLRSATEAEPRPLAAPIAPRQPEPDAWQGCLSCDACRAECSVQRSAGRLFPSRLVRLAALGHAERVIGSAAIWYCRQCLRCTHGCPSAVAPAAQIRAWRAEALGLGLVDLGTLERYEALGRQLERARARLIAEGVLGHADLDALASRWEELDAPDATEPRARTRLDAAAAERALAEDFEGGAAVPATLVACMSCRECMTTCPVAGDGALYDPVRIFRMVRLGLTAELLDGPEIWLCLGCGACTSACTQGVAGHRVIERLQELAILRGRVPADIRERLLALDRALLPRYLDAVDRLMRRP